jgi:hypothetical protein
MIPQSTFDPLDGAAVLREGSAGALADYLQVIGQKRFPAGDQTEIQSVT